MSVIKSIKVCENFVQMMLKKIPYSNLIKNRYALNMHYSGNDIYSFDTSICKFYRGRFYISKYNWSSTTRKHKTYLYRAINEYKAADKIVEIDEPIYKYHFKY